VHADPGSEALKILAVDTSQGACSAAILFADGSCAERFEPMTKGHAETLPLQVQAVLEESGLQARELDALAVTVGPGSFTGVRVGLSLIKGMGLALDRTALGITSFEPPAFRLLNQDASTPVAVLFDARRGEIYAQVFPADYFTNGFKPLSQALVLKYESAAEDLAAITKGQPLGLAGHGAPLVEAGLAERGLLVPSPGAPDHPDALCAAKVAQRYLSAGLAGLPPKPLYLRAPDAVPAAPPPWLDSLTTGGGA